jgi:hypothetical protein
MEWLSVAEGVRDAAIVAVAKDELPAALARWSEHGLRSAGLPSRLAYVDTVCLLIARRGKLQHAYEAWLGRDGTRGAWKEFGYPECCRRLFDEVCVKGGNGDSTWAMSLPSKAFEGTAVDVAHGGSPLANVLWRWLGVRAVPLLPCRFNCEAAIRLGEQMLKVGERAGRCEEVKWITEILSWPVEWSALHGIAETKTPILKMATHTDATASKRVVRWLGSRYPSDGATGICFPYRAPRRRLAVTG